jgi:hypothetical protein
MTGSGIEAAKVRNGIEEFLKGKYLKFRGATPAREERRLPTQTRPSRPRQRVIGSARKRPFAPDSPLCGNRRLSQVVEQRLGLFEVGGVEAFGKPAEDRGEQGDRLLRPALLSA